jgi:hypothetical protein
VRTSHLTFSQVVLKVASSLGLTNVPVDQVHTLQSLSWKGVLPDQRKGMSCVQCLSLCQAYVCSMQRAVCEYKYAPHNDVSVNDRPYIRRWSHKIIILQYNIIITLCYNCLQYSVQ